MQKHDRLHLCRINKGSLCITGSYKGDFWQWYTVWELLIRNQILKRHKK